MARGGFPGFPGGGNINNLMKQMQKAQKQMEDMQKELEEKEYEASSGGGAVKVVVKGKEEVKSITLDESVVDPDDIEMLQDLIILAVNSALKEASEDFNNNMGKMTGGLNIPGL